MSYNTERKPQLFVPAMTNTAGIALIMYAGDNVLTIKVFPVWACSCLYTNLPLGHQLAHLWLYLVSNVFFKIS